MSETDKAYVAVKACGCVTGALVAGHGSKREDKAQIKRWMRDGRKVEVTTVAEARTRPNFLGVCRHPAPPQTKDEIETEADRLLEEVPPHA